MNEPLVDRFDITVIFKNGDVGKMQLSERRIKSLEDREGWMDMALEELQELLDD
jgi:hypothetical protein